MAPGPRVQIAEDISLLKTTETSPTGQEDEEEEEDRPRLRYYRSEKVLGELYRAIDEQAFLEGFQSSAKSLVERHEYNDPLNRMATSVLQSLWAYVRRETAVFQTDHLLAEARNIKEMYSPLLTFSIFPPDSSNQSFVSSQLRRQSHGFNVPILQHAMV